MDFTAGMKSPPQFRLWSGIFLLAAAPQRRIWVQLPSYQTFPSMMIMLVGPPAAGKFVIERAKELMEGIRLKEKKKFHIASTSMTYASLIDELAHSSCSIQQEGKMPYTFHSLISFNEEFRVLLPGYHQEFIAKLDYIWNCPKSYEESRRKDNRQVTIPFPQLNLLGGTTPSYLSTTFPPEAWDTGICRRLFMIYASESPYVDIFDQLEDQAPLLSHLQHQLDVISNLHGPFKWEPQAWTCVREWFEKTEKFGTEPKPTHSKLIYYNGSRIIFLLKLCQISALSRSGALIIQHSDAERALHFLRSAEERMPDIFRAMRGKSDREVMEELHRAAMGAWTKFQQKPLKGELLRDFLTKRIPGDKVENTLIVMEKSGMLSRIPGSDLWIPKPYSNIGVE
jgi:hypothetical protein